MEMNWILVEVDRYEAVQEGRTATVVPWGTGTRLGWAWSLYGPLRGRAEGLITSGLCDTDAEAMCAAEGAVNKIQA